ncbi:MAG: non-homologous end-joining DNA ligase [Acidimicrobiales bacterium]
MPPGATVVEVEGRQLSLSNLDKVLYPATGFTKGHVIDYYRRVAPALLPHLRGRPLTLKRYPDGTAGPHFYEKNCPSHAPPWVPTATVRGRGRGGEQEIRYCTAGDLATLVWLANLAALELHPLLATGDDPDRPTVVAFDLDPGPPAGVVESAGVALLLRRVLDDLGLAGFPKTSGSKGLQVYVPLNRPHGYDDTKGFAHALARLLAGRHPDQVVERMDKGLRRGKVLIDWSQNDRSKTTVCAYSLRAGEAPTVSAPLGWDEVEAAVGGRGPGLRFEAGDVLARVERRGDLFEPVLSLRQSLPRMAG